MSARELARTDGRPGGCGSLLAVSRLAWLVALCVAAGPARAVAEPPVSGDSMPAGTVLVWPPSLSGVVGEQAREGAAEALTSGLRRSQMPVVWAAADAAPCPDAACYRDAARARGAAHAAVVRLAAVDRDYSVEVDLIDAVTGEVRPLREGCSICGLNEALTILESMGPRLRLLWETARDEDEARRKRGEQPRLRIVSEPAGAQVFVDGEPVGVTPLDHLVTAGRHRVEVRLRRHVTEVRELDLPRGTAVVVDVPLRHAARRPPTQRSRALLIAGASLAGAGLVGLGVMSFGLARGAALERRGAAEAAELAAQGVTGLELTDALADVRADGQRADTLAVAGGVAGGVLVVGGVVLAAVSTTNAARRVAVAPWGARGLAGLSLVGRF